MNYKFIRNISVSCFVEVRILEKLNLHDTDDLLNNLGLKFFYCEILQLHKWRSAALSKVPNRISDRYNGVS